MLLNKYNNNKAYKKLKLKVDNNGINGLIHKSRCQTGNRKLDIEIVKKSRKAFKRKISFL